MNTLSDLRVGIDVGGTNTDAVVIDSQGRVLQAVKRATTLSQSTAYGLLLMPSSPT